MYILRYFIINCFLINDLVNCLISKQSEIMLISRKIDNRQSDVRCLTADSTAIAWFSDKTEVFEPVVEYFPKIRYNVFDCKIHNDANKKDSCTQYWTNPEWKVTNSFKNYLGSSFDSRWEDLPTYKTENRDDEKDKNELQYIKTLSFSNENNFVLEFSVKIEHQAQIFLCDEDPPPNSKCYWFLIGGWEGKRTALRKCDAGRIPSAADKFPGGKCAKFKDYVNHTEENPLPLKEGEWNYFFIKRNGSTISLNRPNENFSILEFEDDEPINSPILNVFVHSRRTEGLWKVHQYFFLYTEKITSNISMGFYLYSTSNEEDSKTHYICVTFFTKMCNECSLKLTFTGDNSHQSYQKTVTVKRSRWEYVKILIENVVQDYYSLYVSTINKNSKGYWAIDDIRQCSKNEIRTSKITTDLRGEIGCQYLPNPSRKVMRMYESNNDMESQCSVDTFGKDCHSCEMLFGNETKFCEDSTICSSSNNKYGSICHCSAGNRGSYCDEPCSYDRYGFQCHQVCGNCENRKCNKITGACDKHGCEEGYIGDSCKIESNLRVLIHPPKLLSVGPTYFEVQLESTEVIGGFELPKFYVLQISTTKNYWQDVNKYDFYNVEGKMVEKLNASTVYFVRAVLESESGEKYLSEQIPVTKVETTCIPFREEDVTIIPSNASAQIQINNNSSTCPPNQYEIYTKGKLYVLQDYEKDITNLRPHTRYLVVFYRKQVEQFTITFKSLEGVPSQIQNLQVLNQTETSVTLKWDPPVSINGELKYYSLTYQHLKYLACAKQNQNEAEHPPKQLHDIKDTYIELDDLEPYSMYSIEIYALTSMKGETVKTKVNTTFSEEIDGREIPNKVKTIVPNTNYVIVILEDVECKFVKGNLTIEVHGSCSNDWCTNSIVEKNITLKTNTFYIPFLLPYSNYSLNIKFRRANSLKNKPFPTLLQTEFVTLPGVPNAINNLRVFSKTNNEISLSWLPPQPPTGELEGYFFNYKLEGKWPWQSEQIQLHMQPSNCIVWNERHCATFKYLCQNENCYLNIHVKNKNVDKWSEVKSISLAIENKDSSHPKNLAAKWNDNELILTWTHPDFTNGEIKSFIIEIKKLPQSKLIQEKYDILNYNLTYTYKIKENLIPSNQYTIYIFAFTLSNGERNSIKIFTPPNTPKLTSNLQAHRSENDTIKVLVPSVDNSKTSSNDNSSIFLTISGTGFKCSSTDPTYQEIIKEVNLPHLNSCIIAEKSLQEIKGGVQFIIGDGKDTYPHGRFLREFDVLKDPLRNNTPYIISAVLMNEFYGKRKYNYYNVTVDASYQPEDQSSDKVSNLAYLSLLVLLIIPVLCWLYIKKNKTSNLTKLFRLRRSSERNSENFINPDVVPLTKLPSTVPSPVVLHDTYGRFQVTQENTFGNKKVLIRKRNNSQQIITSVSNDEQNRNCSEDSIPMLLEDTRFIDYHQIKFSRPVKVNNFEEYVKDLVEGGNENNQLYRQHKSLPRGMVKACECGTKPANKNKNRYNNLTAYDYNRVVLEKIDGDEDSDYINASYIDSFDTRHAYIATQDPKITTVEDFWRMIWQENVNTIIMVANSVGNNKNKCAEYWSTINNTKTFEEIIVISEKFEISSDYEFTSLKIIRNGEERAVNHLNFTAWSDYGVPLCPQSLVQFIKKIKTIPCEKVPIVVHCGAGVGRIGTIILCDMALRMAAKKDFVDMWKLCTLLRHQRVNMVYSEEQYKLAHLVVLECMFGLNTNILCENNFSEIIEKHLSNNRIEFEMDYLERIFWQDQAMKSDYISKTHPENTENNRYQNVVSALENDGYMSLKYYPIDETHFSYINAVYVDGFLDPKRFIATQQPLPNSIGDFWRLVAENEVKLIISLNQINSGDKTSCFFWPLEDEEEMQPTPFIVIKCLETEKVRDIYEIINLLLTDSSGEEENNFNVTIIYMNKWLPKTQTPKLLPELLILWEEMSKLMRASRPAIVTCYDGVTASGLFLALTFLIEKINLYHECDVCLAVRTVRLSREPFVRTRIQFEFLYEAVLVYLSSFDTYSNFKKL